MRFVALCVVTMGVLVSNEAGAERAAVNQGSTLSSSWRQVRTPDFSVIGNAPEGELRRISDNVRAFRAVLSGLFPDARMTSPVPTIIVAFRDYRAFSRFQPRDSDGKRQQRVGGYLNLEPDANVMALPSTGADQIIFHEYAHYLIHLNAGTNLPTWLDEGLAEFYSTFERDNKGSVLIGRPPDGRLEVLYGNGFLPLREVVSPRNMERLWRSDRIGLFYAEAWALVHYVIAERGGTSAFGAYLKALADSKSQDTAFEQAFGMSVADMERELRAYVKRSKFLALRTERKTDGERRPAERVPEADVRQIQGRLLNYAGATAEAEKEFQAALALDPTHLDARTSLASLRLGQDRFDEAIAMLRDVTEAAPNNLAALYYLGVALAEQWQHESALDAFERAVKTNPKHAASWAGLSGAVLALGRDSQARAALALALELDTNPRYYLRYTQTALRIGRDDFAAAAAHRYIDRVGLAETSAQYASFLAAIAHWRAEQAPEADAALASAESAIPKGTWTFSVLQFLQGRLDADRLLETAKTTGEKTEAHTYIGFKQAIAGLHEEASVHFRWVVEKGARNYIEFTLARNELARRRHASAQK